MCKSLSVTALLFGALGMSGVVDSMPLGIGEKATAEIIAGWDIDVRPDGKGLPVGQGSVVEGESLYEAQCASCHGLFGEGEGRWPVLAGGEDTLDTDDPEKTVGSYWPYASTLWDYIHRAMPYPAPQSLSDDETYAISAYVLYLNDIVDEDFVANKETFAAVKMPNEPNFYVDNRPDVKNTRCMNDCLDPSTFDIVTTINGITPTGHFKEDSGVAASHHAQNTLTATPAVALANKGAHVVKMLNSGQSGAMVFEPAVLKISIGDTVTFVPADGGHNSASVPGLIPSGGVSWEGDLNEQVEVTFNKEGVYVYQCDPHVMMAMVGVISVGSPSNLSEIDAGSKELQSRFVMNQERLSGYLAELK